MSLLIRIWSVFSLFDFVAVQLLITKVTIVATILISHTCIPNYSYIRTNQILLPTSWRSTGDAAVHSYRHKQAAATERKIICIIVSSCVILASVVPFVPFVEPTCVHAA